MGTSPAYRDGSASGLEAIKNGTTLTNDNDADAKPMKLFLEPFKKEITWPPMVLPLLFVIAMIPVLCPILLESEVMILVWGRNNQGLLMTMPLSVGLGEIATTNADNANSFDNYLDC